MTASNAITRALISVSDKTGLEPFAKALAERGIDIVSTGGTARLLSENGVPVRDVSDLTGYPEMLDGRVKTLHPKVHGGLLARGGDPAHDAALAEHGIPVIDLLAVNLYPFESTVSGGADFFEAIENIDIGGPALIRAAAKNHDRVTVIVDPADYEPVLEEMAAHGGATLPETRRRLATKAYARTAAYDSAISAWMAGVIGDETPAFTGLAGRLSETLRYGENPHQWAAFYRLVGTEGDRRGVATARQLQGKALSYNNLNDTDAAFELVAEFPPDKAAVAIIKHANPCGVALGKSLIDAYKQALMCDPQSAFGGIVAVNRRLDAKAARAIAEIFTEVIIAPDAEPEALEAFSAKKNLRVLLTGGLPDAKAPGRVMKLLSGGFLVQSRDAAGVHTLDLQIVTDRAPDARELADMRFAFTVAKHVKSNAIVYAKNLATVGVGAGQMSRVDAARIAAFKAREAADAAGLTESLTEGSVVASDAFFPFADGLEAAASAGATAVIQPGGSMRDQEVIAAANKLGLAMVFTGVRHFRH